MVPESDSSIPRDAARKAARRALRETLLTLRRRLSPPARRVADAAIARRLDALLADIGEGPIGVYWPFADEPDLHASFRDWSARGLVLSLPVVDARAAPLRFVAWRPGEATAAGAFGIPRPASGVTTVPRVLVVPCVGFDARCFRIGHGGGYYDRTLAALVPRPLAVGVAYDECEVADVEPMAHDVPLDAVVTPTRTLRAAPRRSAGSTG